MADISPSVGFLADQAVLYGSPDGESIVDEHRDRVKIENTDKISFFPHFIAKLGAHRNMKKNLKETRIAIKYLRRYQAQKIVLEAMENESKKYGDHIRSASKLKIKDIQERISKENRSSTIRYESNNILKYNKWTAFKTAISRGFWEKIYIARFKAKAYTLYNNQSKRNSQLAVVNRGIDSHKKKLRGHLFHNFNINAILWGRIKKENNYKGIFPDPEDIRYVKSYITGTRKNKNNNNNASSIDDKTNANENVNTIDKDKTNENVSTIDKDKTNENVSTIDKDKADENVSTIDKDKTDENVSTIDKDKTDENVSTVDKDKTNDSIELLDNSNNPKTPIVNDTNAVGKEKINTNEITAETYHMSQEAFDDLVADGFEPGTKEFNQQLILTGMGTPIDIPEDEIEKITAEKYHMNKEAFDDLVADGFEPGTKEFNQQLTLTGMGKPIDVSDIHITKVTSNLHKIQEKDTSLRNKDSVQQQLNDMMNEYIDKIENNRKEKTSDNKGPDEKAAELLKTLNEYTDNHPINKNRRNIEGNDTSLRNEDKVQQQLNDMIDDHLGKIDAVEQQALEQSASTIDGVTKTR